MFSALHFKSFKMMPFGRMDMSVIVMTTIMELVQTWNEIIQCLFSVLKYSILNVIWSDMFDSLHTNVSPE